MKLLGGGRTPDFKDEPEPYGIKRTIEEAYFELPQQLIGKIPGDGFSFIYEFTHDGDLHIHKIEAYDEETNDMVDVTKYKELLKDSVWAWIEKYDYDNYVNEFLSQNDDDY